MNTHNFKKTILAAAIISILIVTGCAETMPPVEDINNEITLNPPAATNLPASSIYQATSGELLQSALNKIASRSGIVFKVNTDISHDVIKKSVSAENWNSAISQLLEGYNYASVKNGNNFQSITIISRGNSGETQAPAVSATQLLSIFPKNEILPDKYRDYPAGSVTSVDLPIKEIMSVANSSDITLDLPMGKFTVTHDRTVNEFDGSNTWVGFLKNEGPGYHVFLSEGNGGIMGHISTPDGTYNLESDTTGTYLLNTSKLNHVGYAGDMISAVPAANEIANAAATSIMDLQAAVNAAQTAYNQAVADYNKYLTSMAPFLAKVQAAQTTYNNAVTAYNAANSAYVAAYTAKLKSSTAANKAALTKAETTVNAAKATYTNALNAYNAAATTYNSMVTVLQGKLTVVNSAKTTLTNATNALAAATTKTPSTGTAPSTNTASAEIDIMVLYTTAGMTADYAKQRIAYLVTVSNQAYIDSKMNMKLRLVYAEPTTYIENNANSTALSDLAGDKGVFAGVKAKRAQVGADLVYFFRPLYQKVAGSCGTTYVEFANGGAANASIGYGTISDGNAKDTSGYYCAVNTFTHEIGHSLGLVHDPQNSVGMTGVFPDSYALGVTGKFGTIMSYQSPVVLLFSNPALTTQCAGGPCGYANSTDQLKAVNYTAPIVAQFLPKLTQTPVIK